ncbi:MAG TPA: beta-ketoacyl-[acyl-carrier-protein] synthase family protein, partial [Bryobacteraceae bacterium]|nr:beta-ketoacyl-[acyl-carrier-protein] synthase family protein [Bryobacteraceae bacterium]
MRRVVITGMGIICSAGRNREEFLESLRLGRSGITRIEGSDICDLRFQTGGEVKDFVATDHMSPKAADMIDRFAQFAVVAAREAVTHSGIELTDELRDTSAIITGSCVGGQATENQGFYDVYKMGKTRVHPMTIPKTMANAGASAISLEYGITGPSFTIATACSSSAHALGLAFMTIRSGMCDFAISGGSEAPFSYGLLKAWEAMRVVSPTVCRPFSRDRNGMTLGEGSAMLTLEALDHALARGAKPIAEIVGFGMSADAHHITQPSAEGAAKALRIAMKDAGIGPEQVGYVNAHGTGTTANDATETKALHLAFGAHAEKLAISSTKAMHGHTLGAAGAIE